MNLSHKFILHSRKTFTVITSFCRCQALRGCEKEYSILLTNSIKLTLKLRLNCVKLNQLNYIFCAIINVLQNS